MFPCTKKEKKLLFSLTLTRSQQTEDFGLAVNASKCKSHCNDKECALNVHKGPFTLLSVHCTLYGTVGSEYDGNDAS